MSITGSKRHDEEKLTDKIQRLNGVKLLDANLADRYKTKSGIGRLLYSLREPEQYPLDIMFRTHKSFCELLSALSWENVFSISEVGDEIENMVNVLQEDFDYSFRRLFPGNTGYWSLTSLRTLFQKKEFLECK